MSSLDLQVQFRTTMSQHGMIFGSEEAEHIVRQLDRECGKVTGDPQLCMSTDRTRQYTVDFFNRTNCFHKILTRFVREDGSEVGVPSDWSDKWAVLLGACAMRLGVAIGDKDRDLLRSAFHRLNIHRDARKQMEKALEQYKSNEDMWDFDRNESRPLPDRGRNPASQTEVGNALGQSILAASKKYGEELEKTANGEGSKVPKK